MTRTEERPTRTRHRHRLLLGVSWLWVAAPFAYGVVELVTKISALFH